MARRCAPALLLLLLAFSAAAEQQPGWAYDLANELMSPYCPGRTLAECPSQQAKTLVMWIVVQESAGRSLEDVKGELVERYGERMLGAPRASGFGVSAYAVPVLAFLLGGVFLAFVLRRFTRGSRPETEPAARGPLDPELERLVDEELSR